VPSHSDSGHVLLSVIQQFLPLDEHDALAEAAHGRGDRLAALAETDDEDVGGQRVVRVFMTPESLIRERCGPLRRC